MVDGFSLDELMDLTNALLSRGYNINDINAIRNYDRLPINKGRRPPFERNEANIYPANEIKPFGKNMDYLNAHQRAAKDIAKAKGRIYIIYLIIVMNTLISISSEKWSNHLNF